MLFLLDKGYRVLAHDRRGHGREFSCLVNLLIGGGKTYAEAVCVFSLPLSVLHNLYTYLFVRI